MEAVPATSGARRTVRLAAALVVGQVLLVAVVGWVTLTRAGDHRATSASGVDQLAAPPGVIPPAPLGAGPISGASHSPGSASSPPARKGAQSTDSGTGTDSGSGGPKPSDAVPARSFGPARPGSPGAGSSPTVALSAPAGLFPPPASASTPAPSTTATTPPAGPAATPSPTGPASPAPTSPDPVLAGLPCDRMGDLARADDGRMVRCLPTRNGQLRWKIV